MSAVVVLVPVLTSVPWGAIGVAIAGVAANMGMSVAAEAQSEASGLRALFSKKRAAAPAAGGATGEAIIDNTQVAADEIAGVSAVTLSQGDLKVHIRRKKDGSCAVCAEAPGKSKAELGEIAQRIGKKLVQQLVYNKVMTELKSRDFQVLDERLEEGDRIRIRVSRWV